MVTRSAEPDTNLGVELCASVESVYDQHASFVRKTLTRMGVPAAALDDAVQDVFLVWVRRGERFRGDAEVTTYLYAVARRVAANGRRTDRRTRRRLEALQNEPLRPSVPDPEDAMQRARRLRALVRAVAELPAKLKTVYTLSVEHGLTAREIGSRLALSPNTVSSRLRLARSRIADALEEGPQRPSLAQRLAAIVGLPWRAWVWPAAAAVGLAGVVAVVERGDDAAAFPRKLAVGLTAPVLGGPAAASRMEDAAGPSPPMGSVDSVTIEPRRRQPPRASTPRSVSSADDPMPTVAPSNALKREAALIAAAQRELQHDDTEAALAALRRHGREFVDGALRDERAALLAAVLCSSGRRQRGLRVARQLAERAPASSALATATTACNIEQTSNKLRASSDEASSPGHEP